MATRELVELLSDAKGKIDAGRYLAAKQLIEKVMRALLEEARKWEG